MNKNFLLVFGVLFVVVVGFQIVEPAAAVKVIDKRTLYCPEGSQSFNNGKYVFKVYRYNNGVVLENVKGYEKVGNKFKFVVEFQTQFKKISKNKLQIKESAMTASGWQYIYKTTSLNAEQYYWKIYKPSETKAWLRNAPDRYWAKK